MLQRLRKFSRQTAGGGLFLLALVSSGCGGTSVNMKGKAVVKGKVTLASRPLSSGIVVFKFSDGLTAQARIRPDGSYQMPGVPLGETKIGVGNGPSPPPGKARQGGVSIPSRYNDPQTSGLSYTVTAPGEQEKNIELTP